MAEEDESDGDMRSSMLEGSSSKISISSIDDEDDDAFGDDDDADAAALAPARKIPLMRDA